MTLRVPHRLALAATVLLGWMAPGIVFLWPFLWFSRRLPDSTEVFHLTWTWAWLLAPLPLILVRRTLSTRLKREGHRRPRAPADSPLVRKALLALSMPFLMVYAADRIVAATGFERTFAPIVFVTPESAPTVGDAKVLQDPRLLYRFTPGHVWNHIPINSIGFRDREVDAQKAPGVRRVICLGDSITAQGRPGYSWILHDLLQSAPPDSGPWEAFNMGVYGYSARQGLELFRIQARDLQPDVITIYFGPNDRNLADLPDSVRMVRQMSPGRAWMMKKIQAKPLGQALLALATPSVDAAPGRVRERSPRVPPEEYERVMRSFVKEARDVNCVPILITAPRRELGEGLVRAGHAESVEAISRRHDAYNDIVRAVARETGAPLLDLAALMARPEHDASFAADGIHFDAYSTEHLPRPPGRQPGLETIAAALHAKIRELVEAGAL